VIEPIDRDDIEGLAKAAYAPLHDRLGDAAYHLRARHDQERYRKVAIGVRDALVPDGYVVVSRADQFRLIGLGIAFKGLLSTLSEEDDEHYALDPEDAMVLVRARELLEGHHD
jgi:hypothetical protein